MNKGNIIPFPGTTVSEPEETDQAYPEGLYRVDFILLAAVHHGSLLGDMNSYHRLLKAAKTVTDDGMYAYVEAGLADKMHEITYKNVASGMSGKDRGNGGVQ